MTGVLLFRVSANTLEGWPEYLVISYPLCGLFRQGLPYIGEISPVKFTNLPYITQIRA